jgi:hypothetical protein
VVFIVSLLNTNLRLLPPNLAAEFGIPVEKVEAMTKEEMEAHMKEKIYDLEGLVDNITDADNISWGDTEYNCDSDFYLDINEDGEE